MSIVIGRPELLAAAAAEMHSLNALVAAGNEAAPAPTTGRKAPPRWSRRVTWAPTARATCRKTGNGPKISPADSRPGTLITPTPT